MSIDRWTYVEEFDKLSPFTDGMIETRNRRKQKGHFRCKSFRRE